MSAPQANALAPALLTDLYQLTMLDAYYTLGMEMPAVFEFFVRRLPAGRNFLVAAGLEQVLDYLESLHFTADEIEWLASTRISRTFKLALKRDHVRRIHYGWTRRRDLMVR